MVVGDLVSGGYRSSVQIEQLTAVDANLHHVADVGLHSTQYTMQKSLRRGRKSYVVKGRSGRESRGGGER